jgi:hypothetical protein
VVHLPGAQPSDVHPSDMESSVQLPWLADERFEIGLDARQGVVTQPTAGHNILTVTSCRAIQLSQETGKHTTSLVPLERLSSVEVVNTSRPGTRMAQGALLLGIGILLGLVVWATLEALLLILIAGGLPTLVGIYLLAGYVFPDGQGELLLHADGLTLRTPLLSPAARRDAYLVAHRVFELMAAAAQRINTVPTTLDTSPSAPKDEAPASAEQVSQEP